MQVLCKRSDDGAEIRCAVCGQGFELTWERQTKMQRAGAIQEIARILRSHHQSEASHIAHPSQGFVVSQTDGSAGALATTFGQVPNWAL